MFFLRVLRVKNVGCLIIIGGVVLIDDFLDVVLEFILVLLNVNIVVYIGVLIGSLRFDLKIWVVSKIFFLL